MAKHHIEAAQKALKDLGYYIGGIDGDFGPVSLRALQTALKGVPPVQFKGKEDKPSPVITKAFDAKSKERFNKLHPEMQRLLAAAREIIPFTILDSTRGRAAQEKAFKEGHSKAHFGDSAHNYSPAIAADVVPIPLDWNNRKAFLNIQKVIGWYNPNNGRGDGLAKHMRIPIRWGGDWNMDGNPADGWDLPHYELHPWREYAKQSKLFQG